MVIDNETFTELALCVRRASDGLLDSARLLAVLSNPRGSEELDREGLTHALDAMVAMNHEFVSVEGILRTVWDANRERTPAVC
ncbi:MAG: hypothetical protein ACI8TX_001175 [Hyphomicrobiaceae bacterium]|jgi:hypothetical protein